MIIHSQFMTSSAFCALAIAGVLAAPVALQAEQVTLKSDDGTISLQGEFLRFEDNAYIVNTLMGEMQLSADLVACEGSDCPVFTTLDEASIIFAGSDTVGEGLLPLMLEGWAATLDAEALSSATYMENQVSVALTGEQGFGETLSEVLVTSTSSSDAFSTLLQQSADFGMSSRRINPNEARILSNAGLGDLTDPSQEHIIAVDSLVTIVHPDNPVQILNIAQLRDIFSGRITNWQQVGGSNAPINVYDRDANSGTRAVYFNALFETAPTPLRASTIAEDNIDMSDAVAADPNGIGFVGYAFQRGARSLPLENECGMTVFPDAFSARTEEYPLQRRLYLYNAAGELTPTSREFLDYAQSIDADEVIEKSGFISLGIDTRSQGPDSPRAQALSEPIGGEFRRAKMAEMLGTMDGFERLSSTFRFNTGSSILDRRAPLDMARLVDYLETVPAGTQIKIVGFTDDVGTLRNNQALSERRAAQVTEALIDFAGERLADIEVSSAGFGEISHLACNTDGNGRQINRRVEVWISNPDTI